MRHEGQNSHDGSKSTVFFLIAAHNGKWAAMRKKAIKHNFRLPGIVQRVTPVLPALPAWNRQQSVHK